jgi:ubiquinone/menaquinone biosynthesis C-methylase UbiE
LSARGYQENFYPLYSKLQDLAARKEKAKKIIDLLQSLRQDLKSLNCLDIGCSSGIITSIVQPNFNQMVGIDFDRVGLNMVTPDQKKQTIFIRGDAMHLPFMDGRFEVILCAQVYEHVPNDKALFSEIERVIRPGGMVFFSGPNKLFPIEPHYFLPFFHWLPEKIADEVLRMFKMGDIYDIRSRTIWSLKKSLQAFDIYDMTIPFLSSHYEQKRTILAKLTKFFLKIPISIWKIFIIPTIPNFNWVLIKLENSSQRGGYYVMDKT